MKPFHPFAKIFPPLSDSELEGFAADIAMQGLLVPILLYNGQVLDGQNRERACEKIGLQPATEDYPRGLRYETFTGTEAEALALVIGLNLRRRQLNETQRAMVAARLTGLKPGRPSIENTQEIIPPRGGIIEQDENEEEDYDALARIEAAITTAEAAKALDVGTRTIERAREVIDRGTPAVIAAADAGVLTVKAAAERIIDKTPEQQDIIVKDYREKIAKGFTPEQAAKKIRGTQGTGENEWYTPDEWLERVRTVLGTIELDPASSDEAQAKVQAERYFTAEADGLNQDWIGKVFLNPPYAQPLIMQFFEKLTAEIDKGHITEAISLTHNYSDTNWYHLGGRYASALFATRGRIKFYNRDGNLAAPTQGQTFMYFGPNPDKFCAVFAPFGLASTPWRSVL